MKLKDKIKKLNELKTIKSSSTKLAEHLLDSIVDDLTAELLKVSGGIVEEDELEDTKSTGVSHD